MRLLKSHPILRLGNQYLVDSPQPINLSYLWNFGSLLALCLVIQIITGVTLAMHYNPSVTEAFNSVEHIMRDVNNGWLIRYLHSNTASAFFFLVYLHIGRGLYYGSYKAPRTLVWTIGTVIFILMMATAFLGYVLPYGQMSLWGATVITNLMSAIPWVGQDIVEFIWGGFSVGNATLNRFFSLHFVLPFVLAALALMHLIVLHDTAGSGNPLGISGNYDRLPFAPYFIFKDLITIYSFMFVLSLFVFFMPNMLGDSETYVMANPMQTPAAIVPEWYLLPFYAILRSIPNKLLGVIAMFSAILILLLLPFTDVSRSRGMPFKPFSKTTFYIFVANFLILMQLGAKHVESPFIEFGQISTVIYFLYFFFIMYSVNIFENFFVDLKVKIKSKTNESTLPITTVLQSSFSINLLNYKSRVEQLFLVILEYIALNRNKFLLIFQLIIVLYTFSLCTLVILQNTHVIEWWGHVFMEGGNTPGSSNEGSSNDNGSSNHGDPNRNPQKDNPVGDTTGEDKANRRRRWFWDRMANCDHRLEDRRWFQVGPKPRTLECSFDSGSGTHYAIRRPYDQAYFCQRCFAKICLDCHDPNQPDVSDSEDGGDDNYRKR